MTELIVNKDPQRIKRMFDDISPIYDLMNDLMTFRSIRRARTFAVQISGITKLRHGKILDLATGTGDLLIELRRKGSNNMTYFGLDISEQMLVRASQKLKVLHLLDNNINLVQGSIYNLPFKEDEFDIITMAFGLRNLHKPKMGLKEIYRVLKPNGVFINLESSKARRKFLQFLNYFYFSRIVPNIAGIFGHKKAYKYLADSMYTFYYPEKIKALLADVGFKRIEYWQKILGSVCIHRAIKI